jgi:predicted ATPase/class 3 adenylate cyclase
MAATTGAGPDADGTFTFLFTDIENSTGMWRESPDAMRAALERHDALLRDRAGAHGGTVFKTIGDAFCVAFPNAPAALRAALAIQQALADPADPLPLPVRVRAALHTGDAQRRDDDFFGASLARVARLLAAIHGGQVALTRVTAELVRERLPEGGGLRDLGDCSFRGFDAPDRVFQFTHPSLPDAFPPLKGAESPRHNLPRALTPLVGRDAEAAEVKRLVATSPLVTLTGIGGAGKTRLALHAAELLLGDFPRGVWFVDLAPVSDPARIGDALLAALALRPEPGRDAVAQVAAFSEGGPLLLLLDNCEHLIADCARFVERLLLAAPDVRILATSREGMDIYGETLFPVPPLSLPSESDAPEALLRSEAVRLFLDRARVVSPAFRAVGENVARVASVCRKLDGVPLALLIAASWVNVLTPAQIEQRLGAQLLRASASRTAAGRQQTLEATLDWSHSLLSPEERALFRRVATFSGGWTLEAAEAVCGGDDDDGGKGAVGDVLSGHFGLIRKSLVVVDEGPTGARYRLLEPVRQYALGLLDESGEGEATRARHRDHFLRLAEEIAPELTSADAPERMDRLSGEHDNLRAALAFARDRGDGETGTRFVAALFWFWYVRGHVPEGRAWADAFPPPTGVPPDGVTGESAIRARAANGAGVLAWGAGDLPSARARFEESRDRYERLGDREAAAGCLNNLGMVSGQQGELEASFRYFEESLTRYRETGNRARQITVLGNLGQSANLIHEADPSRTDALRRAGDYLTEALALLRDGPASPAYAGTLFTLAGVRAREGATGEATVYFLESLAMHRALDYQTGLTNLLVYAPELAARLGDPALTARTLGAAAARAEAVGALLPEDPLERITRATREALGADAFAEQETLGRLLNLDEIAEAFSARRTGEGSSEQNVV